MNSEFDVEFEVNVHVGFKFMVDGGLEVGTHGDYWRCA